MNHSRQGEGRFLFAWFEKRCRQINQQKPEHYRRMFQFYYLKRKQLLNECKGMTAHIISARTSTRGQQDVWSYTEHPALCPAVSPGSAASSAADQRAATSQRRGGRVRREVSAWWSVRAALQADLHTNDTDGRNFTMWGDKCCRLQFLRERV